MQKSVDAVWEKEVKLRGVGFMKEKELGFKSGVRERERERERCTE